MTITQKIQVVRGDDHTIAVTFKDENGNPIDITGATVYFTIKRINDINDSNDTNAIVAKEVTSHTDASAGETEIVLTGSDLSVAGLHKCDVQVKYADNTRNSIPSIYFEILPDITRA